MNFLFWTSRVSFVDSIEEIQQPNWILQQIQSLPTVCFNSIKIFFFISLNLVIFRCLNGLFFLLLWYFAFLEKFLLWWFFFLFHWSLKTILRGGHWPPHNYGFVNRSSISCCCQVSGPAVIFSYTSWWHVHLTHLSFDINEPWCWLHLAMVLAMLHILRVSIFYLPFVCVRLLIGRQVASDLAPNSTPQRYFWGGRFIDEA